MPDALHAHERVATRPVKVWDLPVRIVHWALLPLVAVAVLSGLNEHLDVHFLAGHAILGLVVFRLVWGVVGSDTARFARFVRGPGAVMEHLRHLRGGVHEAPHLGHNPLGALAVVALLLALAVQATTGLFSEDNTYLYRDGPLFKYAPPEARGLLAEIHKTNWMVLLGLIGLHVAAVFGYLWLRRENLVRPMITGVKIAPADQAAEAPRMGGWAAFAVAAAVAGAVVWAVQAA